MQLVSLATQVILINKLKQKENFFLFQYIFMNIDIIFFVIITNRSNIMCVCVCILGFIKTKVLGYFEFKKEMKKERERTGILTCVY
jgi:hypothetical protein